MTRSPAPRRLAQALATGALLLSLAGGPAGAAAPAPWKAVLVAGDNAEPVFDNAVAAVALWLAGRGVKPGDIHRFSASPPARDPSIEPASGRRVLQAIADLAARPGERCLIFMTSHGKRDEGLWLAYRGEFLTPAELARALALGCAAAPSVVIVSSCYSGAFSEGAMQAANRIILTAARADRPSFGCAAGYTYTVFDECLLATLAHQRSWRATYRRNLRCVQRREKSLAVLPSRPQAFFGAAVRTLTLR
ncbi:MAG TPA: C13 family peptidase [Stellaceae bacterium]|nr:C13 family peptidase [Stellaceae bacterium]